MQAEPTLDGTSKSLLSGLRVAIVHYWFVGRAGGERVVEALAELFPQADLFCLVADRSVLAPELQARKLTTSFLQRIPGSRRFHRHFLPLQPLALKQFDLSGYDLVLSSESGPAKGVITSSGTCHICYCHSPMRYIWEMYPDYRRNMGPLVGPIFSLTAHYMRLWDVATAARVDHFVANSRFVASRIRKHYGRESTVIHPPVEAASAWLTASPGDYYLAAGRLVDYKRVDLAIAACTRMGRRLKVVGDGPEYKRLRRMAGPSVEFLGSVSEQEKKEALANCRALLFPGEEDFGIVPVEAQAFGRPVIAYASGAALETVRGIASEEGAPLNPAAMEVRDTAEAPTGVFFAQQTESALVRAILDLEAIEAAFSPQAIREHALQFDAAVFRRRFADFVRAVLAQPAPGR
jgi:glycosyltransferase involved in cell wall biosynthesis